MHTQFCLSPLLSCLLCFFRSPSWKIRILKCVLSSCIIIWPDSRKPCGCLCLYISTTVINTHQHTVNQRQMAGQQKKWGLRENVIKKRNAPIIRSFSTLSTQVTCVCAWALVSTGLIRISGQLHTHFTFFFFFYKWLDEIKTKIHTF